MATYQTIFDESTGVTHIVVSGEILADEWLAFMQSEEFQKRRDRLFCDMTDATLSAIETRELIRLVREVKPLVRAGIRAAYLLKKGVDFGIANMFKVYSDQLQYTVALEPFTDRDFALDWLLNEDLQTGWMTEINKSNNTDK